MGGITKTATGWSVTPTIRHSPKSPPIADALVPRGQLVKVSFVMAVPNAATREQIEEWTGFELGWGSLDDDNPLGHCAIELVGPLELEDLGASTDKLDLMDEVLGRACGNFPPKSESSDTPSPKENRNG